MKVLCCLLPLVFIFSSCSSKRPAQKAVTYKENSPQINTPKPTGPSVTSKMLGSEQGTDLVTEFSFKKKSADLSPVARKKLKEMLERASKEGEVKEVQVVTWADREYPSKAKEELSEKEQHLVKNRNEAIKEYLKKLDHDVRFTLVNMGERNTFLSRVTASEKAEIKESLQTASVATTKSKAQGPSQASKSIVMFLID